MLCFTGVLVAISSFYGLDAAVQAIKALKEKGDNLKSTDLPVCGLYGYQPDFLLPWNLFPMMFSFIWVLLSFLI